MEFKSQELKNSVTTSSSITHFEKTNVNVEDLRSLLRDFVIEKDKALLDTYDISCFNKKLTESGLENLGNLFNLLRTNFHSKFYEDKERMALIELMFNNINSSLKALKIINTDFPVNEINTIILGFLIKNFI